MDNGATGSEEFGVSKSTIHTIVTIQNDLCRELNSGKMKGLQELLEFSCKPFDIMGLKPVGGIRVFRVPKNDDARNNEPPAFDGWS